MQECQIATIGNIIMIYSGHDWFGHCCGILEFIVQSRLIKYPGKLSDIKLNQGCIGFSFIHQGQNNSKQRETTSFSSSEFNINKFWPLCKSKNRNVLNIIAQFQFRESIELGYISERVFRICVNFLKYKHF